MAKQPKRGRPAADDQPPKKAGRTGSTLSAQIDESIRVQMDAYIDDYNAKNPHPATVRSTLEAALKMFLEAEGFWPPPAGK